MEYPKHKADYISRALIAHCVALHCEARTIDPADGAAVVMYSVAASLFNIANELAKHEPQERPVAPEQRKPARKPMDDDDGDLVPAGVPTPRKPSPSTYANGRAR